MKIGLAAALLLLSVSLFLFSAFAASTDAQGAIVFLFTLPLIFASALASAWLGRPRLLLAIPGLVFFLFTVTFMISAFVPSLNPLAHATLDGATRIAELVTGEQLRAADRNDVAGMINTQLKKGRIDFDSMDTAVYWDKICIFGPHTTDATVREVTGLGSPWLPTFERTIAHSDAISALIFIDRTYVRYYVEYPRAKADFLDLSGRCFRREEAVFALSEKRVVLLPVGR